MSPGLKRARQPFLFKNIATGVILSTFVLGVYTYSIRAVKQDEFDDIDEEAKARAFAKQNESQLRQMESARGVLSVEEEKHTMEAAARAVASSIRGGSVSASGDTHLALESKSLVAPTLTSAPAVTTRGLLPKYLPFLLDSSSKSLVRGAPPVDNIGTVGGRR